MGRPTKYKQEYEDQAYKLCLLGATDKELADFFGVTEQTVNNWKGSKKGFFESIKRGREVADSNVSERLYMRALGYRHPELKVFCQNGEIITHEVEKQYPPDTSAAIFWLKNRRRDLWKDYKAVEHSGSVDVGVNELENMTDDELDAEIARLRAKRNRLRAEIAREEKSQAAGSKLTH